MGHETPDDEKIMASSIIWPSSDGIADYPAFVQCKGSNRRIIEWIP